MDEILGKLLDPLLNKMGRGWKTVTGLTLLLAVLFARQMDWIDEPTAGWLGLTFGGLFGVGIYHKAKGTADGK